MSTKKFQGMNFSTRGSNKKYVELDDLDNLYEMLKEKSRDEISKELNIPYNSINYVVRKYFPPEWIANIKVKRFRKIR